MSEADPRYQPPEGYAGARLRRWYARVNALCIELQAAHREWNALFTRAVAYEWLHQEVARGDRE